MGNFKGAGSTPSAGGGNYLGTGLHYLKIRKLLTRVSSRPSNKGQVFAIAEVEILSSNNPTHTPGSTRSWAVNMIHGATALGNIKAFLQAAGQLPDVVCNDDAFDAVCDALYDSETNPLMGYTVCAEGFDILTDVKKQPFTKFNWEPDTSPDGKVFPIMELLEHLETLKASAKAG